MKKTILLSASLCFLTLNIAIAQTKPKAATTKPVATKANTTAAKAKPTFKDERDGQVYKTAVIDGKTWIIEPFRFKPAKCDCIYWEEKDTTKGAFYTAIQAQKVIPDGWRIPTVEEYEALLAKTGKTPAGLTKEGFSIELLGFNLDTYQTIKQYKNDAYMTSVLVGDKKAFNTTDYTEFLALKISKRKLDNGSEYDVVDEFTLRVSKDATTMVPGPARGYLRLFLIKS